MTIFVSALLVRLDRVVLGRLTVLLPPPAQRSSVSKGRSLLLQRHETLVQRLEEKPLPITKLEDKLQVRLIMTLV
jgi:hypothetical protein